MKISIFYFSGTGNTEWVAEQYREHFSQSKNRCSIHAIENCDDPGAIISESDLCGFGFPVHAFNAPRIMFEFIDSLPFTSAKKAFIFKTAGDPMLDGGANTFVRRALRNKGFTVTHEGLFIMPANVFTRYDDALIERLKTAAIRRAEAFCEELLEGTVRIAMEPAWFRALCRGISAFQSFGARRCGQRFRTKGCTDCGKCIDACPTKNITRDGRGIIFGSDCTMCLRCVYTCPVRAIKPGMMSPFMLRDFYDLKNTDTEHSKPMNPFPHFGLISRISRYEKGI